MESNFYSYYSRCSKLISQVIENEDVLAQVLVTALTSEYRPDTVHTVNPNEFNPTAIPLLTSKLLSVEKSQKSHSVKSEQQCKVEEDLISSSHPNSQTKIYCKANCDIIICSDPAGSNLCRQNRSDESMNNPPRDNRKPVQKHVCYSKPDAILKKNCGATRLDSEEQLTPGSVLHTILELQKMNSITDRQALGNLYFWLYFMLINLCLSLKKSFIKGVEFFFLICPVKKDVSAVF